MYFRLLFVYDSLYYSRFQTLTPSVLEAVDILEIDC